MATLRDQKESLVAFWDERSRLVVLAVGIVLLLLYLFTFPSNSKMESYAGNLSAGLIGSFLTIFFVDDAIERKRKNERIAINNVALKQLRGPIIGHLSNLSDWYKATAPKEPASWPKSIRKFLMMIIIGRYVSCVSVRMHR